MSYTISQILQEFKGMDKAFWASYTVDFGTVDFLMKKDFRYIMNHNYMHVISDFSQFNESLIKEIKGKNSLSKVKQLQEYCTFSQQDTAGAFHPKILLLASEEKIVVILGSANLTSSGILSNQDLMTVLIYEKGSEKNLPEITSIYNYLNSMQGWISEAKYDLEKLGEQFPELLTPKESRFISIPNEGALLDQMINKVQGFEYKSIRVFSPFFDDDLKGLSKLKERAGKPVTAITPVDKLFTTEGINVPGVSIKTSKGTSRPSFHSKFYQFEGENESIVFWGSANCSYSGLIDTQRNYEFLLLESMSNDEVDSLWGKTDTFKNVEVEKKEEFDSNEELPLVLIKDLIIEEETLSFKCSDYNGLVLVATDGQNKYKLNYEEVDGRIQIEDNSRIILFWWEDNDSNLKSNYCYINRPERIFGRLAGDNSDNKSIDYEKQDRKAFKSIFGFFNIEQESSPSSSKRTVAGVGFWRMPHYSKKRVTIKLINFKEFVDKETSKITDVADEDSENIESYDVVKKKNDTLIKFVSSQTNKLKKNLAAIEKGSLLGNIDWTEWKRGVELLLLCLLKDKLLIDNINDPNCSKVIRELPLVLLWCLEKSEDGSFDDEDTQQMILILAELAFSTISADLKRVERFDPLNKKELSSLNEDLRIVAFVKELLKTKLDLNGRFSDYLRLLRDQLVNEYRYSNLMSEVLKNSKSPDLKVFKNKKGDLLLYLKDKADNMELLTLSGEHKVFRKNAPLENININD